MTIGAPIKMGSASSSGTVWDAISLDVYWVFSFQLSV